MSFSDVMCSTRKITSSQGVVNKKMVLMTNMILIDSAHVYTMQHCTNTEQICTQNAPMFNLVSFQKQSDTLSQSVVLHGHMYKYR